MQEKFQLKQGLEMQSELDNKLKIGGRQKQAYKTTSSRSKIGEK